MSEETEKPATVIVTTETGREIRFRADEWDAEEQLDVLTATRQYVASFAAGRWTSVRLDGVIADDDQAKALGIARKALEAIARISDANVAIKLAEDALDEIFAETDL